MNAIKTNQLDTLNGRVLNGEPLTDEQKSLRAELTVLQLHLAQQQYLSNSKSFYFMTSLCHLLCVSLLMNARCEGVSIRF